MYTLWLDVIYCNDLCVDIVAERFNVIGLESVR